jgi:DUF1009 family protein
MSKLGIIAGAGSLPAHLINICQTQNKPFFVLAIKGQTDPAVFKTVPHAFAVLGALEQSITVLKSHGVDTLVMAGGVKRPSFAEIKPDLRTMKVFMRLGMDAFGDDALLRAVRAEFEKDGIRLIGAHEVDPGLLSPSGLMTTTSPSSQDQRDIERGIEITKTLGSLDIGQAAVIQNGLVLALEAIEGTDNLLQRAKSLKRKGGGGVLVKSCKPQQDKNLDLPTIGPRTVARCAEAGLNGIAVESGASLIVERKETIHAANKLGLFIHGF